MQRTRQRILEYLRQHGEATVDELSTVLDNLTAVTVRHHLDVLRGEGLVGAPEPVRRNSPGRPKYIYRLTEKGYAIFPQNLNLLTGTLFTALKETLDTSQINVIFDEVAGRMAAGAGLPAVGAPIEERLQRVVEHLNDQGYEAVWERHEQGYVLHTSNCPYSSIVESHDEVCALDMRYISKLLGTVPRRLTHMMDDNESCSYLVVAPVPGSIPRSKA